MRIEQIAGMNQNYRQYSYRYFLESMQMAGYRSIELWLGAPHVWVDSQDWHAAGQIRRQTKEMGLQIVSVTTPSGGAFQYQYAAQEPYHRERSIRYFMNGVRMTAELGAEIMTVNSGWGYWDEDDKIVLARNVEILGEVCREAQACGVKIAIESLTREETLTGCTLDQVSAIIDAVGSSALYAMIDLGAVRYSRETSAHWFERFGDRVIHYHFQDGDEDPSTPGHYPWGKGSFDLYEELRVMKQYDYQGILTQEICDSDDPRRDDMENMRVLREFCDEQSRSGGKKE